MKRQLILRKTRSVYLFIEFPQEKAKALALKEKYHLEVRLYYNGSLAEVHINDRSIFEYTSCRHLNIDAANTLWRQLRGEGYTRRPKLKFISSSNNKINILYADD